MLYIYFLRIYGIMYNFFDTSVSTNLTNQRGKQIIILGKLKTCTFYKS